MLPKFFRNIIEQLYELRLFLWCKRRGIERSHIYTIGFPIIDNKGNLQIDEGGKLIMVNNAKDATLGINRKCKLNIYKEATLHIKGKVRMSNTVIVATKKVTIGNNVMIGGGVTIVDSDFHSLNYNYWGTPNDEKQMKSIPVHIGNNVFIGMNTIILKGVTIGNGAVIGAGSVVSSNIPENEIWVGNPARFLKKRLQ